MTDSYVYLITALLPLAAFTLVVQVNPYHALVVRGILGAVAALVYTVLGAADVALTEALVGTLLAIMLYAVAVRSSMILRLGVLKDDIRRQRSASPAAADDDAEAPGASPFDHLVSDLRSLFRKYHMRVELIPYRDMIALERALAEKKVHAICAPAPPRDPALPGQGLQPPPYHTTIRLRRLHDILQTELGSPRTSLRYAPAPDSREVHS